MADRVHPHGSPEALSSPARQKLDDDKPQTDDEAKLDIPPPRTYIVKVPKDQILRVPPPQNAKLYECYTSGRASRRGRRCCCLTLLTVTVLVILAGAAAGILYLVVKPESPSYSVTALSITGFNLTSSTSSSLEIVVSVRAKNANDKVGIYHVGGSSVRAYYTDVSLGDGILPVLYLPPNSETAFNATVRGNGIVLGSDVIMELVNGQNQGSVPLRLKVKAPVKFRVGAVKTWKITVKLTCGVTVDKLNGGG